MEGASISGGGFFVMAGRMAMVLLIAVMVTELTGSGGETGGWRGGGAGGAGGAGAGAYIGAYRGAFAALSSVRGQGGGLRCGREAGLAIAELLPSLCLRGGGEKNASDGAAKHPKLWDIPQVLRFVENLRYKFGNKTDTYKRYRASRRSRLVAVDDPADCWRRMTSMARFCGK